MKRRRGKKEGGVIDMERAAAKTNLSQRWYTRNARRQGRMHARRLRPSLIRDEEGWRSSRQPSQPPPEARSTSVATLGLAFQAHNEAPAEQFRTPSRVKRISAAP